MALAAYGASAASPKNGESYSLECRHEATKRHPFLFRLAATYAVAKDGTAQLSDVRGVLLDDSDLSFIVTYDTGPKAKWDNDVTYKAKKKKWADHLRFFLKPVEDKYSGNDAELIIDAEPSDIEEEKWDNHVNTGTNFHSTFHAGLEYHFSDQDGNRDEITCAGLQVEVDRK